MPTTAVNRMPVSGTPNASNVLVPIQYNFLFLSGGRGSVAVQSQGHHPVLPQFSNARTVAYIMPAGSTGVGGRGLPAFLQASSNQQGQFVFRVTNPASCAFPQSILKLAKQFPCQH